MESENLSTKPKKNNVLSFKVDDNFKRRLEFKATKANRSMSNFVMTLLTKAMDDLDQNDRINQ